jgi:hypothetical protein
VNWERRYENVLVATWLEEKMTERVFSNHVVRRRKDKTNEVLVTM